MLTNIYGDLYAEISICLNVSMQAAGDSSSFNDRKFKG